jgi:hypothetical protein
MTGGVSTGVGNQTVVFEDISLFEQAETFVYRCTVEGVELFFETVAFPTGRELLDSALQAFKGEA